MGSSIDESNFHELLTSGPLDSSGRTAKTGDGDKAVAWYVGVGEAGVERQTLKAFVICSADSHAKVAATSFTVRRADGGSSATTCPHGTRAVGGGVGTLDPHLSGFVQRSAPVNASPAGGFENGDVAKGWSARVENIGYNRGAYKVFAICEPE